MYSSEQIKNIKVIINSYFENKELQSLIKKKIKENKIKSIEDLDNEKLIELLKDIDLLDQILIDLKKLEQIDQHNQKIENNRKEVQLDKITKRAIAIKICSGQAFVDYLVEKHEHRKQYFQIYLNFQNQRFETKQIPVCAEPEFNETFIFNLETNSKNKNVDLLMLSKLDCQIELVIVLIKNKKEKEIFSLKQIEWRHILCFGSINLNIELLAYELAAKLVPSRDSVKPSLGVLQVHLDLFPKSKEALIPEKILNEQLLKEKKYRDIEIMQFYEYSQEWWSDYKSINPNFDQRPCKIYAENEDGIYLPVSSYLLPLWNVQGIDSPYHASRFVSLIPLAKQETPGGERIECWQRFHTFLCSGKGDFESHALLLCSLLLGFGMDAFVVVGTSGDGPHL